MNPSTLAQSNVLSTEPNSPLAPLRKLFASGQTKDVGFRIEQLKKLKAAILAHESDIYAALKADLRRPEFETFTAEIGFCLDEINDALKHVRSWAKPRRVSTSITHFFSTSRIHSEPLGVVLVIAPWNYPVQLAMAPLIAALAAGNCAVVKPSELAPATSKMLAKLLGSTFSPDYVKVVEGGVEETQKLLAQRFDHIFFTGGTSVGRIIMEAAAKHLTPVTLELGGKSPCIVEKDYPVELAARRIMWGKFYNCGQTCIAPDYLLVHQDAKDKLLSAMKKTLADSFGSDPKASPDYARIISTRHYERLEKMLKTRGTIVTGGQTDPAQRYIAPTIIEGVDAADPLLHEEIFGPILPVLTYSSIDEAMAIIAKNPKPLALYLFTKNKAIEDKIVDNVQFGGGCINDTLIHISSSTLPFGGIGPSGMGAYHGKFGFDLFSHRKSVMKKTSLFDVPIRYAPYTALKHKIAKFLMS